MLTTPQKAKSWTFNLQEGEVGSKNSKNLFSTETLKSSSLSESFHIYAFLEKKNTRKMH